MKVLRVIIIIVVVLVALLVILGLMSEKSFDVSRTATVNAPVDLVFPYVKSLNKMNNWGPWNEQDPTIQNTYEGEEGTVGSKSFWDSENSGKGEQEVTLIRDNEAVQTELTFNVPWGDSKSQGYFNLEDKGQTTDVTWGLRGENDFISRIFSVFMNTDEAVGPMFARGLENLDSVVQHDLTREWNGYTIGLTDMPAQTYLTERAVVRMDNMQEFFTASYGRLMRALGRSGLEMTGAPSALYYTWDEESSESDMAAALPVAGPVDLDYVQSTSLKAARAIKVDAYGSYDNLGKVHSAIDSFMHNFELDADVPVVEVYVTDPSQEQDESKWLTTVLYRLK